MDVFVDVLNVQTGNDRDARDALDLSPALPFIPPSRALPGPSAPFPPISSATIPSKPSISRKKEAVRSTVTPFHARRKIASKVPALSQNRWCCSFCRFSLPLPLSLKRANHSPSLTCTPPLSEDVKRPVYLASEEWVQRDSHPASSASWRIGTADDDDAAMSAASARMATERAIFLVLI